MLFVVTKKGLRQVKEKKINTSKMKFVADVRKLGCRSVVIEANSPEEALDKLIEEWGEDNIITPPEPAISQAQIDSIENEWGID